MKQIVVGTTNAAKLDQIRLALASYDVDVKSISNFPGLPQIIEDGTTARENALNKAVTYAKAVQTVVLTADYALFFDGLPAEEQPGLNVRRIPGYNRRPTDEELFSYYLKLIDKYGGRIEGWWEYAIAIAKPDGYVKSVVLESPRRLFLGHASSAIVPGHPLGSLQFDTKLGKYIAELTSEEQEHFLKETIGQPIYALIEELI